jgi:RimJ/RimL family protein N-acetyltransferase
MPPAPVLQTPRLLLRQHRPSDLADSLGMWSDPVVTRYLGGTALSEEEVWLRLLRHAGSWALLGYGFWLVQDRASGAFAGEVGFHELRRDTQPSFAGTPEIGWGLLPRFQGQGMAREAVQAALAWGDAHVESDGVVCMIHPDNAASLRVAQAAGFEPQGEVIYKGGTQRLFKRPRALGGRGSSGRRPP